MVKWKRAEQIDLKKDPWPWAVAPAYFQGRAVISGRTNNVVRVVKMALAIREDPPAGEGHFEVDNG